MWRSKGQINVPILAMVLSGLLCLLPAFCLETQELERLPLVAVSGRQEEGATPTSERRSPVRQEMTDATLTLLVSSESLQQAAELARYKNLSQSSDRKLWVANARSPSTGCL